MAIELLEILTSIVEKPVPLPPGSIAKATIAKVPPQNLRALANYILANYDPKPPKLEEV